jgi:hypothetical protein
MRDIGHVHSHLAMIGFGFGFKGALDDFIQCEMEMSAVLSLRAVRRMEKLRRIQGMCGPSNFHRIKHYKHVRASCAQIL